MEKFTEDLIAPCGINCGICIAHLRKNNPCRGCHFVDQNSPKTRTNCRIRICPERTGKYCYQCDKYPCERLLHLDQRYQAKYGMSEIENLAMIQELGIDEFIASEGKKWQSDIGILCVHDRKYYQTS